MTDGSAQTEAAPPQVYEGPVLKATQALDRWGAARAWRGSDPTTGSTQAVS